MKFYNALSRSVEEFVPADPGNVTMYVCGPTVYGAPHMGNMRSAVVFDLMRAVVGFRYPLTFMRNYTDIDDKIIAASNKQGIPMGDVVEQGIEQYEKAAALLNIKKPDLTPRATDNIPGMIAAISKMVASGAAYVEQGHVFFDTETQPHGIMTHHKSTSLAHGTPLGTHFKRNRSDFVLWKPAKEGEPSWPSPWGAGRPGWHIECSVMSALMGPQIDIHGGGADLRFPHHECEISQGMALNGCVPARYWVHNGLVVSDGKMGKSRGARAAEEIIQHLTGETARVAFLMTHHRSELHLSSSRFNEANKFLLKVHRAIKKLGVSAEPNEVFWKIVNALENDLNTVEAFSIIRANLDTPEGLSGSLAGLALMGVELREDWPHRIGDAAERHSIHTELKVFNEARERNDWDKSDASRLVLQRNGVNPNDPDFGWHARASV